MQQFADFLNKQASAFDHFYINNDKTFNLQ